MALQTERTLGRAGLGSTSSCDRSTAAKEKGNRKMDVEGGQVPGARPNTRLAGSQSEDSRFSSWYYYTPSQLPHGSIIACAATQDEIQAVLSQPAARRSVATEVHGSTESLRLSQRKAEKAWARTLYMQLKSRRRLISIMGWKCVYLYSKRVRRRSRKSKSEAQTALTKTVVAN